MEGRDDENPGASGAGFPSLGSRVDPVRQTDLDGRPPARSRTDIPSAPGSPLRPFAFDRPERSRPPGARRMVSVRLPETGRRHPAGLGGDQTRRPRRPVGGPEGRHRGPGILRPPASGAGLPEPLRPVHLRLARRPRPRQPPYGQASRQGAGPGGLARDQAGEPVRPHPFLPPASRGRPRRGRGGQGAAAPGGSALPGGGADAGIPDAARGLGRFRGQRLARLRGKPDPCCPCGIRPVTNG